MPTYIWTGNGDGTTFSSAANWNPNVAPNDNSGTVFEINKNASLTLTSAQTVFSLLITNNAAVTLNGAYTLDLNGNSGNAFELDTGSSLTLGSTTTLNLAGAGVSFGSGTGTATISGGKVTNSTSFSIGTGQTLLLTNTNFTSSSAVSGPGTFALNGSTATFSGSPPTATVYFDTVPSGGTPNILNVGSYENVTIQNFGYGDEISEGGLSLVLKATGGTTVVNGVTLSTYELVGNTYSNLGTVTLAPGTPGATGAASGHTINLTNTSGSEYGYPCFYPGTMLATPDGEIAVEDVVAGTMLKTAGGAFLPVRWLGWSEVSAVFGDPLKVLPIRITAGALADGVPARDLLVSPDHALCAGGVLVQAAALVNGVSIIRETDVPASFRYYHVELATHELLLAESCPAESFVDNVNRMAFHNWDERAVPATNVPEMDLPRVKSARQLPPELAQALSARAGLDQDAKAA